MVEGTSLENWQACKRFVGSNPTLSAIFLGYLVVYRNFSDSFKINTNRIKTLRVITKDYEECLFGEL